ncbi:large ribosomal subunit protein uL5 [Candidatus Vidania fulgoroideorum]
MISLKEKYKNIIKYFKNKKICKNIMQIPKILKVVLNSCVGIKFYNKKISKEYYDDFKNISLQKPVFIRSKKSISNFNLRKNEIIGLKVTMRKDNMYDFLNKLINISLPRIKDFEGFSKNSFDDFGNYNFGILDHNIFPEIFLKKGFTIPKGIDICINIKSLSIEHSYILLKKLGFPFI